MPSNVSNFYLKIIMIVLCMVIAAVGALGFLYYTVTRDQNEVQAQKQFEDDELEAIKASVEVETIYENIYINKIHIGGLTKSEALQKLTELIQKPLGEQKLKISYLDQEFIYTFDDFKAEYAFAEKIDEAYNYARKGTLHERNALIMKLKSSPMYLEAEYSYGVGMIVDVLSEVSAYVDKPAVDAGIERVDKVFVLSEEKSGLSLNIQITGDKIADLLASKTGGFVNAVVETVEPTVKMAELKDAQSLIGTFKTTFTAGQTNRNTNISNAANKIDNFKLMPGEVFSTNANFGPTTFENGYRPATVIINGKFSEDFGGGVCQVSSTLYMAVLYAELKIVERANHSLKVAYMDYGYDATLAGDYIDFKFENNTPYPVFVESVIESNKLTINIYGYEMHSQGRKLEFENKLIQSFAPEPEVVREDPSLPLGERVVVTAEIYGHKYEVYKKIYENNVLIDTVKVNTSTYKSTRGEVKIGTGPERKHEEKPVEDVSASVDIIDVITEPVDLIIPDVPVMP